MTDRHFRVPLADLYAQYMSLKEEIDEAIREVIQTSAFIRGPYVQTFEEAFAAAIGARFCVSCGNGTDALYIALRALGVERGAEVIVPAQSWISTAQTVTQAGGTVVFCDTDDRTYTMSTSHLESLITTRTVGVVPVHLYGQAADMDAIMSIARKHRLWVLEDCAQSHLARYKGQVTGTFGHAAAFSFYPGKNLGAMGDAGAILTQDPQLAERMAMFARHGGLRKGEHRIEGINSRLDGMQAAVLLVKLRHLDRWTAARRRLASMYLSQLGTLASIQTPEVGEGRDHVWHLFVVQHEQRDNLKAHLAASGIQTSVNYPVALPFLPAYARLGHAPADFPNAFKNQGRILSLPLFAEMVDEQLRAVVEGIRSYENQHATVK